MRGKAFAFPRSVKNSVRSGNGSDVGVDALVPVEEPFGVDHVADLQCFNS